ncbi:TfoX/Sxy family protein [Patiriisocius hiemis]|uniref:TfoX/Sxy family protein n=1 Tax=Patiriisocius hiemis TaxID=3075604 RepID=A0ABU2YAB2_9FLAO|nr:TfoX/Sxy family protein [Constantimarinum sp. W242]MDT0554786.1 TfoX/Sxy family protein [Constantimarinum sp. W242]
MTTSQIIVERLAIATKYWADEITQKKMFGGTCFLYKGKMCVGETKQKLMVRIVAEKMETILQKPEVKPMDFTGKPMKEFIFVTHNGFDTEEKLQYWVELGIEHAKSKTQ